jgi:hypothetical protein
VQQEDHDDDEQDLDVDDSDDDDEEHADGLKRKSKSIVGNKRSLSKKRTIQQDKILMRKKKRCFYFHYIKHAIENATSRSKHVNMRPCYGFDITPSSGHLLDKNNADFIETSLPRICPPANDFHSHLLNWCRGMDEDDDD